MRIYLLCAGIFGILYYLVLAWYSGKWNSTFAGFWLAAGGTHLILGCVPLSYPVKTGLFVCILAGWVLFLIVEVQIFFAMKSKCEEDVDYLIVLGAQVRGRRITRSLLKRLEAAEKYLRAHPRTKVIVSGGQGRGEEISEAEAMAGYLEEHGIAGARILLEDKSTSTRENLRFSSALMDKETDTVAIVTNDFHLYRAMLMGKREGYERLKGLAADSHPVFQLNYLVREFFAVLALKVRRSR